MMTTRIPDVDPFLAILRMGQANALHHLIPLAAAVAPARLIVVRPGQQPPGLTAANIDYLEVKARSRVWEVLLTTAIALRITARQRPQMIFSFNAIPYGLIAVILGRVFGLSTHVGFIGRDIRSVTRYRFLAFPFTHASLITAPGAQSISLLEHAGIRGVRILEHGIDSTRFAPQDAPRDIDCIYVGTLTPVKRVDLILDAALYLKQMGSSVSFVVIGDGPLRDGLERTARDCDLGSSVQFVGFVQHPELWLTRARLFLLPSDWEGMPFALIEAMACGVVPIATPVGALPEIIDTYHNGVLFGDDTPQALARIIESLLSDHHNLQTMAERARSAVEHLTYTEVANFWRDALRTG